MGKYFLFLQLQKENKNKLLINFFIEYGMRTVDANLYSAKNICHYNKKGSNLPPLVL